MRLGFRFQVCGSGFRTWVLGCELGIPLLVFTLWCFRSRPLRKVLDCGSWLQPLNLNLNPSPVRMRKPV